MQLSSVRPGDIVLCNVRGHVFHAEVLGKEKGRLTLEPITANVSIRSAKSREVVRHWRAPRTRSGG